MGKSAIILVAAFMVMGGVYTLSTQRGFMNTKDRVADHQHEVLSRNAAVAGYQRAQQQLADNFAGGLGFSGTYNTTDYKVTFSATSGTNTIVSEGRSKNAHGEVIPYRIKGVYKKVITKLPDDVEKYTKYAVISEDDMTLKGNVDAPVYAEGDEANELNANVHTNGYLTAKGGGNQKNIIKGYGTYVDGSDVKHDDKVFQPENPIGDSPLVYAADPVDIPYVNTADIVDSVSVARTVETVSGPLHITESNVGDYAGSRENPKVLHVEGDMDVSGNAVLNGYAMFIVDGSVSITGGSALKAGDDGYTDGDESSIAIYAAGTVDLRGNSEIWAQILANEVVSGGGTTDIYGGIASAGKAELKGGPTIYYRKASRALATSGFEVDIRRSSYNEWAPQ